MNEILIVPDVHGRRFWEPALDYPGQIIFLGDYFDPIPDEKISETDALETILRIVSFKQKNPDKVTLLIGNHELHYFPETGKYSRFSPHCHVVINEMLTNGETKGLFQACKQKGKYLFIHGGITKGWYDKHYGAFAGLGDTLEERINRYFVENRAAFEEVSPKYRSESDQFDFSSPLWADIRELDEEGNDHFDNNIIQIVGHTQTEDEKILVINNVGAADNQKLHILRNGEFDLYE